MLDYILLGLLKLKPMTGYELKNMIDHSTGHFWHAYHSQIYTTLRKLEADGMVGSREEPAEGNKLPPRVYTLTEKGQAAFLSWLGRSMEETSQVKEPLLVRTYFSADRPPEEVLAEMRVQRELHARQLEEYRAYNLDHGDYPPDMKAHIPFWKKTLEFGLAYERIYLEWLDSLIAELETRTGAM